MDGRIGTGFSGSSSSLATAAFLAGLLVTALPGCAPASEQAQENDASGVKTGSSEYVSEPLAQQPLPGPARPFPDEVVLASANPGASLREPQIIYFEAYGADVEFSPQVRNYLDQVKALLSELPDARLAVVGHSDASGARDVNIEVARQRARRVAERLKAYGFRENELQVSSRGPDQPLVPNDTAENRARNRRVELHMIRP